MGHFKIEVSGGDPKGQISADFGFKAVSLKAIVEMAGSIRWPQENI